MAASDVSEFDGRVFRVVEAQVKSALLTITDTQEEFEFLEGFVEATKPAYPQEAVLGRFHYLIATSFRYPLPVPERYAARFRPPFYNRNVFYASVRPVIAYYEYAYHWLRQRVLLSGLSQSPEPRTQFSVMLHDPKMIDIRQHPHIAKIMDRNLYTDSHQLVRDLKEFDSIQYPSCRDPERGECVAVFNIFRLSQQPEDIRLLHLIYDSKMRACRVESSLGLDEHLPMIISWDSVV